MNNNILHNRLNAKNEQHLFHILPYSYLPFAGVLITGVLVVIYLLIHPTLLKDIEFLSSFKVVNNISQVWSSIKFDCFTMIAIFGQP